jgi:hypothetical protein
MTDEGLFELLSNRVQKAIGQIREVAVEELEAKSIDDLTAGRLATIAYELETVVNAIRGRLERGEAKE